MCIWYFGNGRLSACFGPTLRAIVLTTDWGEHGEDERPPFRGRGGPANEEVERCDGRNGKVGRSGEAEGCDGQLRRATPVDQKSVRVSSGACACHATSGLQAPYDFWSSVPGAKEYDESLAAKNSKSPALPDKTWLDDPIEKARRLWEWWRANHNKFTYFSKAARLVVLVQTSSCAVERVFSQVKYILETVGDLVLEESLEARLMERINCGKY